MSDQTHVIEAHDLRFGYRGRREVLRGVSIRAAAGRFLCVLGPNGSGKTTLLRCLLGLLDASSGRVVVDGKDLGSYSAREQARLMAYVPQAPRSAFAFSVRELVLMGRFAHVGALGLAGKADLDVANAAMEMTDTLAFADRTLSELSGGEAQCAMVARALAQQPSVMLLDEPTSHLDIRNQLKIYQMMQRLAHDWRMAVVCVSHDVNLASRFADELVLIRDGQVMSAGAPASVICREVLGAVYGVEIDLIDSPGHDAPIVVARSRSTGSGELT